MAQVISPLASYAIENKTSPVLDAPPTEFPYPESDKENERSQRVESEATLCEDTAAADTNDGTHTPRAVSTPTRPTLAAAKFMTEAPKPVALPPVAPLSQRRSTGANPLTKSATTPLNPEHSSSDDEQDFYRRKRSSTDHNPLSKSRLNQVRRRPSRTVSKIDDNGRFSLGNEHFHSRGKVAWDGRLDISVNETANSGYLAKALGGTIHRHLHPQTEHEERTIKQMHHELESRQTGRIPVLNIVIMVIGSRGDIQPFLKIGRILKDKYNHRVRIATHPTFKKFVEQDIGLEFFSVGGDPSELMSFMVKNPGLIPSLETVKAGEIGRRRDSMFEMFQGFWRACINATDDEKDAQNLKMMGDKFPFVADAIIANPPSFAHFHCAEKLGIPLHLVFTFPYTPTQAFPHPLANIKASNVDQNYTNYMSYPLVDLMTWQGLGDLVNRFRIKTLGLPPVSTLWAPGQLARLRVSTTYLWSPGLVPKPEDWGPEIDIAGYVFLDLASSFEPPKELEEFLGKEDDRKTVYIGFGSISGIDDPTAFTRLILDAVEHAGVRAVISKGWGGMGEGMHVPDSVLLVDNVPHDWLFPQMDAVVHHGGAGTTAMGLKCGKPTMIVPFFGDQPFWSAMVAKAGAGAKQSLPLKKLDAEKFAEGIRQCLSPEAREKARAIAKSIEAEGDGAENAVESFHRSLPLDKDEEHSMRCGIFNDRIAVWRVKHTKMQLSALAADLLVENKQLKWADLQLLRHREWHDFQGPGEPLTGASGAALSSLHEVLHGISNISETTRRDLDRYDRAKRKKKRRTVADGITMPGQVAHAARGTTIEAEKARHAEAEATVNLHGDAEPMGFEVSPTISRATTDLITATPAPITILEDIGQGIGHSAKAIVTMPLDIWTALALGFRNAPRLYGDATVRPPPNTITGVRSGLKAASSELWLGLYDGVTGLVRIPYHDVQASGMAGLPKGVARGVGGLVLKPMSGMIGVGAYSGEGVRAGLRKRFRDTTKTDRWIRRARMTQGAKDVLECVEQEQEQKKVTRPVAADPRKNKALKKVRTQALTQWSRHEKAVADGSEKEKKRLSLLPNRDKKPRSPRSQGQ